MNSAAYHLGWYKHSYPSTNAQSIDAWIDQTLEIARKSKMLKWTKRWKVEEGEKDECVCRRYPQNLYSQLFLFLISHEKETFYFKLSSLWLLLHNNNKKPVLRKPVLAKSTCLSTSLTTAATWNLTFLSGRNISPPKKCSRRWASTGWPVLPGQGWF